jgi:C4-dicarboxylate transporter, DctQ subunit
MIPAFARAYDRFVSALGLFAGFVFGAMALGIGTDVAMRNLFGAGFGWTIEVIEYAMLVATIAGAPWVLREGAHVTVDVLVSRVAPAVRRVMQLTSSATGLAICTLVGVYGTKATLQAIERGSMVFKSVVFPEWWVLALVPLGMAMMAIEFARLLCKTWRNAPGSAPGLTQQGGR